MAWARVGGQAAAALLLGVGLMLPWWNVTCDDGCSNGKTGLVEVSVLGTWRGVLAAMLTAASVIVIRNGRSPRWATLMLGASAVAELSMMVSRPRYSTAAPYYFGHHLGWDIAIAGIAVAAVLCLFELIALALRA